MFYIYWVALWHGYSKSSVNILMVFTLWIHSWLFPKPRSSLPWKSLHHYPCLLFRNISSGQRFFFYYEDPVKEWTKTLSINYVKPTDIDSGLHGFFITAILQHQNKVDFVVSLINMSDLSNSSQFFAWSSPAHWLNAFC